MIFGSTLKFPMRNQPFHPSPIWQQNAVHITELPHARHGVSDHAPSLARSTLLVLSWWRHQMETFSALLYLYEKCTLLINYKGSPLVIGSLTKGSVIREPFLSWHYKLGRTYVIHCSHMKEIFLADSRNDFSWQRQCCLWIIFRSSIKVTLS